MGEGSCTCDITSAKWVRRGCNLVVASAKVGNLSGWSGYNIESIGSFGADHLSILGPIRKGIGIVGRGSKCTFCSVFIFATAAYGSSLNRIC